MESLFIINSTGDVFLEKHWRSVISKSICDYFLEKLKVASVSSEKVRKEIFSNNLESFRMFLQWSQHHSSPLISSLSSAVVFLSSSFVNKMCKLKNLKLSSETSSILPSAILIRRRLCNWNISTCRPPLFVIEFLHRVVDTFEDYFSECNETVVKENYVVIYELLDEMLDNGFPLATESNILKELIKPPNIL